MIGILFLVGLIGNIIGTLAGGGGLITLPTMLLLGMPAHSAIGANKISSMISSFSSIATVLRSKELTKQEVLPIGILCAFGGILGGLSASFISVKTLTLIAIVLMCFAFVLSLVGKSNFGDIVTLNVSKKLSTILLAIGFYDGVFGPGSGTLFIYAFAKEKLSYMKSVLLGRVGVFSTCTGAAIVYICAGYILWYETLFLTFGGILGAQIGIRLARRVSNTAAQIILRFISIILIIQLTLEFLSF